MRRGYVYRRPVKRSQYSNFRRYVFFTIILAALLGAAGYFIYSGLRTAPSSSPLSKVQNTVVNGNEQTYTNDYFTFKDSPTWVLAKNNSSASRVVYHKFNKNVLEAEMIVYINQDPIPLYSAVPRVLPLHIINDNSFQPTNVSQSCGGQYPKGQPHKVMPITINGARMLCDPDSPQYFIILSEIDGDYHLHLKTSAGKPIEFVITYRDDIDSNSPDAIINIASSFHTK
jgi:hypothetical protein